MTSNKFLFFITPLLFLMFFTLINTSYTHAQGAEKSVKVPERDAFNCSSETRECYCYNMADCATMRKHVCKPGSMEEDTKNEHTWLYRCKWNIYAD